MTTHASHPRLLGKVGRREEARAATRESLDVRRRIAETKPDGIYPNLAVALANYALGLKRTGTPLEEALRIEQEALGIARPLMTSVPALLGDSHVTVLNNIACTYSGLGRHDDALASSAEAVAAGRLLVDANPGKYAAKLALALWTFAEVRAAACQDLDAALTAAQESVERYEKLAAEAPAAHAGSLRGAQACVEDVHAART
jgi:tetratricopeptide (TPR) repeat protein